MLPFTPGARDTSKERMFASAVNSVEVCPNISREETGSVTLRTDE
jgi:hypothetical protein